MPTLTIRREVKLVDDAGNDIVTLGDRFEPLEEITTVSGEYYLHKAVIADNYGRETLWQSSVGGISDFRLLYIEADAQVHVELRTDNATPEYALFKCGPGTPLMFTANDLGADAVESLDGAALVEGTDFDQINRIVVQRDEAESEGDANVTILLIE